MRDGPGKSTLKQKALKLLKQKRMIESQKDSLESQSWNMSQTLMTTENLKNTMISIDVMKQSNKELKKQYGKINIDKIEQIQDEMEDLLDLNQELQDTMSRSYAVPDDISESELDAELEALGDEIEYAALEGENESNIPSYLTEDTANAPTFIDEPPVEETTSQQKQTAA